jgi:ATP-dependent DNA helicase RecG
MTKPRWHPPRRPEQARLDLAAFVAGFSTDGEFVESSYVEWKTGTGSKPIAKAVTGFSNGDGGSLLLGVDDAGHVVGRTHGARMSAEDALHGAIQTVQSPGRYTVYHLDVEGRPVIVLAVQPRQEGFTQMADGRVLVRRGARNVPLFGADLARLTARTLRAPYETTETEVHLSDEPRVDEVRDAFGWSPTNVEDRLREHDLALDDPARLTIAGALLLLDRPSAVVPKAFIEIYRYRREDGEYDRRWEVGGTLVQQVRQASELILAELGSELVVMGLQRYQIPRLPAVVVREALSNAVAHRSYEAAGTAIRVEVRPDHLVLRSPGGLIEPVTVENMRDQQAARNPAVIAALRRFGLAEDAGRGIDVMFDTMQTELLDPPEIMEDGHAVTVRLRLSSTVSPSERAWLRELLSRGEIEAPDRMVLVQAARGAALTNRHVRELLNVDSVQARRVLQRLRTLGHLRQTGERGGARYTLGSSLVPPAGLRLDRHELEEVVLGLTAHGPIANADVRRATGLSATESRSVLSGLVDEGKLERTGARRGTRYALPMRDDAGS